MRIIESDSVDDAHQRGTVAPRVDVLKFRVSDTLKVRISVVHS